MLVHSYLYYELGQNIISDYNFDYWAKELVDLQAKYPEESKQARYYEEFIDFDGSSGFDLPYHYINIQKTGNKLLEYDKKLRNKNKAYNRGKE
jgi:NAD-dependent DNA ligase